MSQEELARRIFAEGDFVVREDLVADHEPPIGGPLVPGTRLGPYVVRHVLGRGSQGVVYLASADGSESPVAVKVLTGAADEHARARFLRETRAARSVSHNGLVSVLEAGEGPGGTLFYAMELVPGKSLARRLAERGPLDPRDAARLVAKIARAVHAAHEKSILHRDLKPSNVLLVEKADGSLAPKVADFGLALVAHASRLTETGAFLGSPCYAAPEAVLGAEASPAQDVYGLGAVLYECLTGRPPFLGSSLFAILDKVVKERPAPPSRTRDVPPPLERLCLQCLEKLPALRPRSAEALAGALERFLGVRRLEAADVARAGVALAIRTARRLAVLGLGLALGFSLGLFLGFQLFSSGGP